MVLVLILSVLAVFSQKIAEYRLGMNFGQVFRDYSGKENHAVNGADLTTTDDTYPTDRGAYFDNRKDQITLPANSLVSSSYSLPSSFTILGWFISRTNDGNLYKRVSTSSYYFYLKRISTDKSISFKYKYWGIANDKTSSTNVFLDSVWVLVTLIINSKDVKVYINTANVITHTLFFAYSESGRTYQSCIGGDYDGVDSFRGACWYYLETSELVTLTNYVSTQSCTTCLSPTCTLGSTPSFIDPYSGTGCTCVQMDKKKNCSGSTCVVTTTGCSGNVALSCGCTIMSCYLSGTTVACNCLSECNTCATMNTCTTCKATNASPNTSGKCVCNVGYYNTTALTSTSSCIACNSNCQSCSDGNLCTTCKDSNSSPIAGKGCICKIGYYNTTTLDSNGACKACNTDCLTCSGANLCTTCQDANAFSNTVKGCTCNPGYYNTSALITNGKCLTCYIECSSCNLANICTSCKDVNSSPNAIKGCTCNAEYYNITALTTNGNCLKCYPECSTCSTSNKCTTCKDTNSSPDTLKGCVCKSGYYNTTELTTNGNCLSCYPDCKTCNTANVCLACIDSNAEAVSKGCSCKIGYYNLTQLTVNGSCLKCNLNCISCSSLNTCTSCVDTKAVTNGNAGCKCQDGYYNITAINADGTCLACHSNCASCSQSQICLTCKSANSSPTLTGGCKCSEGYHNITDLTQISSCILTTASSIELTSNTSTPSTYFNYILTATLKNQNGGIYNLAATVIFSSSDLYSSSSLTQTASTGSFQLIVYSKVPGSNTITATVGSVTSSITVEIKKLVLNIKAISPIPVYTKNVFKVTIEVLNFEKNQVALFNNQNFNISLSLTPSGTLTGVTSGTTSNGVLTLNNIKIKTTESKEYVINAICVNAETALSSSLNIIHLPASTIILYYPDKNPSMGFEFEIFFELYDSQGDIILVETVVTLTFNDTVIGNIQITTSLGYGTFQISYNKIGFLQVSASVSTWAEEIIVIEIVKNKMQVDFNLIPSQIDSPFDITVTIYDNEGVIMNTVDSLFAISVSASPSCIFSCSGPENVVSGQALFSGCKFITSGTFELTFTSDNMDSVTSGPFLIKDPLMNNISLLNPTKVSTFISFSITVKLLDAFGSELVNPSASLRVSSSFDLIGSLIVLGNSATIDLEYYCVSTGTNTINVKASDIINSITIDIVKNSLKYEYFNVIPTETNSLFGVEIGVYNFDFSVLANLYGDFSVSLSLDTIGTLSGLVTQNENNGFAEFTNLKIETTGIYYLKAESLHALQATSQELIIGILVIKNHTVDITSDPVSICEEFIVTVLIFDQFKVLYSNLATVAIQSNCSDLNNIIDHTLNGTLEFSLYSSEIGLCQLTITSSYTLPESSNSLSSLYYVEFIQSKLKFEVSPLTKLYTTQKFSIHICIYNFNFISIINKYCSFSIDLSLLNSNDITGNISKITKNGCSEFTNLKIPVVLSSSLIASSNGFESINSSISTTELRVEISVFDSNITAFFDSFIRFSVFDHLDNLCTDSLIFSINIQNSNYSKPSENIQTGEILIPFYFKVSGYNEITASTLNYSAQLTIYVRKAVLKIIDIPSTFILSQDFSIKIGVFDYLGQVQETLNGPHLITVNLKDNLSLNLILNSDTELGIATFDGIAITTNQNLSVIATSADMETVSGFIEYEPPLLIILDYLSPNEDLYCKNPYEFQVSVTQQLSKKVSQIVGANVSFYLNDEFYLNTLTNSEGVSHFSLVFNESGVYSLRFEYNSNLLNKEFIVNSSENTDQLCYIAAGIDDCNKCVENAQAINGTCQCYTGSSYNITKRICECPSGQKLKMYSCISCGTYFKASEITSEFEKDYKSIFVYFDRPVIIKKLKNCNNIMSGPETLLNITKNCKWISPQILHIKLSEYPIVKNTQIILNNLKVQALDTTCNYNKEDLIIDIIKKYELPQPSAEINAADHYSLICSKQSLKISASFKSKIVSYAWKSSIKPSNNQVSELISSTITDTIEISKSLLSVSVLKIELTVRYFNLNTWATSSKEISIEDKNYLTVDLNVKSFNQIKKNQAVYLVATVKQACGQSENFSYKWSSSEINLDNYIKSGRKDMLQIPGGTLDSGKQYTFQVEVSEGSAKGKIFTVYEILNSNLLITLTRSSGEITTKKDFSVGCYVEDPDNKDSQILTEWFCVESTGACTDSKGNIINTASKDCNLVISKKLLRSRATYTLTVKASTPQKTSYSTIEVTVNPNIEGVSEVSFPSIKINSDYVNNLIPKITYSGLLTFSWKITGGEYSSENLISVNSFIGIPEFTLKQGVEYRLELDITSDQFKETLKIFGQLSSNLGPICEGVSYAEGDAGTVLTAEECTDGDDEDYPLMYQFGFSDKTSKVRWLNEPIGINTFTEELPLNAVKAYVRVFDNFETSNTYSTEISKKMRNLQDYLLQIMQKVRNPSNVPSTILEYKDLELEYASFIYLFSSFYSYFITLPSTRSNLELFIDCLEGILTHKQWISDEILNNSTLVAIHIIKDFNQRILPEICEKQFLAFQEYLKRIDKDLLLELLNLIGEKLVYDTVPNIVHKYSAFFSFIKLRKIAGSYLGSQVSEGNLTVEFPKNFDIDETVVFDTFFSLQTTEDSFIIHFLVNSSGKYENYTLDIFNIELHEMEIKNPLLFTISNTYNFNDANCKDSKTNDSSYCRIEKVNNTHIVMSIYSQGSYTIDKGSSNCSLTRTPISISAVLFGVLLSLSILFLVKDKTNAPISGDNFSFSVLYNLTSIFISQVHLNRTCSVLRLCSKLLFILAAIGATYSSVLQSQFYPQFTFLDFYQLGRGLLSLSACQILTILINLFMILGKKKESKYLQTLEIIILIIVSIMSILIVSLVCVFVCPEDVTDWLINFAIMGTAEILLLEVIVAKLLSKVCKVKGKDVNMATIIPLGKSVSIDKFPLNDTWHFSPRALKSTIANETYN